MSSTWLISSVPMPWIPLAIAGDGGYASRLVVGARESRAVGVVRAAGGDPSIQTSDFFLVEPKPTYTAVIGNPPYLRYQDFSGDARARSREAALRAGITLSGLASSWAAFTVHSALMLQKVGRLGLIIPAELPSVNHATEVRRFHFEKFAHVDLVLFTERVFPEVQEEVVLLLADGCEEGGTKHASIYQAQNAAVLSGTLAATTWSSTDARKSASAFASSLPSSRLSRQSM